MFFRCPLVEALTVRLVILGRLCATFLVAFRLLLLLLWLPSQFFEQLRNWVLRR